MSISHQLALFIDVVQQGSFAKAAALHDMDNSSLSKQIKKLEATLGVQLLNRSTRSFSLTSAGEDILQQAHVLVDTLDNIQTIAHSYHSEPKGLLRITSPIYFGQEHLQPIISQFLKAHPNVKITLSLDDKRTDIISDHFDLAFRLTKLAESNLIARKIANTRFVLIASPDFIEQHGAPQRPQDLNSLPSVVYSNGNFTVDQMKISQEPNSDELVAINMNGSFKVSDVRTLIAAVGDGLGYALIELSNLPASLEELGLVTLFPEHSINTRDTGLYAVYPHRKQTMLVKEFINHVQQYVGTPPRWYQYIDSQPISK